MGKIEQLVRLLSLVFFALLFGFSVNRFHLFPYQQLNAAFDQAASLFSEENTVHALATHYLNPAAYDWNGPRTHDANAVQPGLTLVTSYWADMDWDSGIKLIDAQGRTLHQWRTNIGKMWPDAPDWQHVLGSYVHGSYLFPDGDILLNMEHTGLFMLDACGKTKWHLEHPTHHSISRDDDGNFWIPGNVKYQKGNKEHSQYLEQFAGLRPKPNSPIYEDRLLKVSPHGEVLADISLLKVLYENDLERYIPKIYKRNNGDILHLNDIDVLGSEMAAQYPMFEAGDIAVSLRHLHMVLVMSPSTGVVKWYSADPWIEQHDPDFTGDGWITVFDNNIGFNTHHGPRRGSMLGGSRLVAVQPHTGKVDIIYPRKKEDFFYTRLGGKQQLQENGNLLITEVKAGRVFEVSPQGRLIWEWVNAPNAENRVAEVMEGTRYAITPEQVASWSCQQ